MGAATDATDRHTLPPVERFKFSTPHDHMTPQIQSCRPRSEFSMSDDHVIRPIQRLSLRPVLDQTSVMSL